ncbi:MAG: hypothetical protein R3213_08540, partial [Flavobacteriaceae bacterium]|nr:hypothetical protein [Flavobacteriaceae bacterium]
QSETLNILFNSGKINIISSEEIKDALVRWPQQVEDITEDEQYSSNIIFNTLQPLISEYVSLYDIYRQIDFKNYKLFNHQVPSPLQSDYRGLLTNRKFEGVLAARELPVSISLLQSRELIETAQKIVDLLNQEIDKLDD